MPSEVTILPQAVKQSHYILVVEDDVALRFVLSEWLRTLNYIVYEAANADEAATVLASPITVDIVITDVDMPGAMNGLALIRYIRKTTPDMNVIVVSGNADNQNVTGMGIPFFKKPYDFKTIADFIGTLTNNNPLENQNE